MNKRDSFITLVIAFLIYLSTACFTPALAYEYDTIVANSTPNVEYSKSLGETAAFTGFTISPDYFLQAVRENVEQISHTLEEKGIEPCYLSIITTGQAKCFTFLDVPISKALSDVVVIRYGCAPSYLALVFVFSQDEWLLTDVLTDVESVEIISSTTNAWLKTKGSAFSDSVQFECLYNLSTNKYEICYLAHAVCPAYDAGPDDVIYTSAYSAISEYSVVENAESVYYCYLYVVNNTSYCSWESSAIVEHNAVTEINIYTYDYRRACFDFLRTNHYEGIGAATIDNVLQHEAFLSGMPIVGQ